LADSGAALFRCSAALAVAAFPVIFTRPQFTFWQELFADFKMEVS
jgi:hypothetical protein